MIEIGPYKLSSIETGEFALDGGAMFGVIPKPLWSKKISVDDRNRIDMRLRAMLVAGKGRNILVDTGIGEKNDAKFINIYRVDHSRFTLEKSLAERGLRPEDITDVVLSHLHFDHAGGATKCEGERIVPAFPNAKYYVQRTQYEWALSATERDAASFIKADFEPLMSAGVLNLLDGATDLFSGISVEVTHGHTEGLQHLKITSGKETLFYCADLIPTSVHVGLPWIMGYDIRPLVTLEEKRMLLKKAAEEDWIIFFEHCPHMAAGRVVLKDGKFEIKERVDV